MNWRLCAAKIVVRPLPNSGGRTIPESVEGVIDSARITNCISYKPRCEADIQLLAVANFAATYRRSPLSVRDHVI